MQLTILLLLGFIWFIFSIYSYAFNGLCSPVVSIENSDPEVTNFGPVNGSIFNNLVCTTKQLTNHCIAKTLTAQLSSWLPGSLP